MFQLKQIQTWWQNFEKYQHLNWILSLVWLILIAIGGFLWHLGSTGLVDETEPLFAEAARQMTVTGDWITPYFNEATRFDKPILIYWLMAIGYKIIGVNEWAARLPSALAAIALFSLGFYTLRRYGWGTPSAAQQEETATSQRQLWISAWIGSALIALNPETIVWGRTGVSDMLLSGCTGIALFSFFLGYAAEGKKEKVKSIFGIANYWYLNFYIFIALAVLTKGPVGIVVPVLIISIFLIYLGKFKEIIQELSLISGSIIFAIITLPWYILVILKNGENYINSFFGYHNLERFTEVVNGHDAPWYFYFLVVLLGFAPWSIYLPLGMIRLRFWQRNFWRQQPRHAQLSLFVLFWFVVIFAFFTIAVTKLPSYVIPLLPAAAMLVALLWSAEITKTNLEKASRGLLISIIINLLFLIILSVAMLDSPKFIGYDPAAHNLAQLLADSKIPIIGAIIWGITAVIMALLLVIKSYWRGIIVINLIGFIAFLVFVITPAGFLLDQARQLPIRQLAAIVKQTAQPDEQILMIGFEKPSLVFYSQRPVKFFDKTYKAIAYLKKPNQSDTNLDNLLILAEPDDIEKTKLSSQDYQIITSKGSYQLIRTAKQKLLNANP